MKVLVACEYSGVVRDAFIKEGHDAMSCDLLPTDVEGPHYRGDVLDIIHEGWDLMIAHPPCTYLAVSGSRWLYNEDGSKNKERWANRKQALNFVRTLMEAPIRQIAVENPISVISSEIRKPDQIIQPWQFGHGETKATCLWLKNLPKLKPTEIVQGRNDNIARGCGYTWNTEECRKARSKTFQGIADAMAKQWGREE